MHTNSNPKKTRRIVNGILIIDKPKGLSSNAALQRVKRLYNAKKAGHTGSLDPLATGLLPICFGTATKQAEKLLASDKTYITTAQLGISTETGDSEGAIVESKQVNLPSDQDIVSLIQLFKGEQDQIPSMYSALKHNGVPLYRLARQGIVIDRPARKINIYDITVLKINRELNTIDLSVTCSKGTYIRTLVEDIGRKLGCGAHVSELRRTAAGPYGLKDMFSIEQLEQLVSADNLNNLGYEELDRKLI